MHGHGEPVTRSIMCGREKHKQQCCFALKLETDVSILRSHSSNSTEVLHHTISGYFSQWTGLLVKFEDIKLVKMKPIRGNDDVFWETTIESLIGDYKCTEGLTVAHRGKTTFTLHRYDPKRNHKRRIEEVWVIEEVEFNINGLSMDCFLPPADLKREFDVEEQ